MWKNPNICLQLAQKTLYIDFQKGKIQCTGFSNFSLQNGFLDLRWRNWFLFWIQKKLKSTLNLSEATLSSVPWRNKYFLILKILLILRISLLNSVIVLHRRKQKYDMNVGFSEFFLPIGFVMTVLSHGFAQVFMCELSLCSLIWHHTKSEKEPAVNIKKPLIFSLVKGWNQIYLQHSWQWPVFWRPLRIHWWWMLYILQGRQSQHSCFLPLGLHLIEHLQNGFLSIFCCRCFPMSLS